MQSRSDRPRAALSMATLSVLLASCGGGGSDSESVPRDTALLTCTVEDSASGSAVADATVNYQAQSTAYVTQTNANGKCRLEMPAVEVGAVQYPAASVIKPGYEPQTLLCASLQGGQVCSQDVKLVPLAANVSIPVGGDVVMHLGDDAFEGAVNSQFQKSSDGVALAFPIPDWSEQVRIHGAKTATVYIDAKGWQSDICNNLIGLSGDTGAVMLTGGISPSAGYWAGGRQVPFIFDVAKVGQLNAELRVVSGTCYGTTDVDDFEINRIRVEFN
jgi:hypothetical protein